MTASRVATVLLLVLAGGAAAPAAAPAGAYFPLVVGARWVRRADDGAQITARVTGQKTVGGVRCTVVETTTERAGRARVTRVCYEATPAQVRAVESETGGVTVPLDPPRTVLRLPPRAGVSWSWSPRNARVPSSITEEWVREETVKVAAGTFRAWKVKSVTRRGDITVTLLTWYAPGVGIVKIAREEQRGPLQRQGGSELVSYRIP